MYAYRRVAAAPEYLKIRGQEDASTCCEALIWSCSYPQVFEGMSLPQHLSPLSDGRSPGMRSVCCHDHCRHYQTSAMTPSHGRGLSLYTHNQATGAELDMQLPLVATLNRQFVLPDIGIL